MIGRIRFAVGCGVLIAASFCASPASAQIAIGPGGYGLGYFNYQYNQPRIPYYALYPPVYYSYPVPRTYGYSPFAYPPGVQTPEVEMSTPLSITNPYFHGSVAGAVDATPSSGAKAPADRTTSARKAPEPLVVINPYVAQPKGDQDPSALQAAYTGQ
jgi:hypothetical protein